jgi:GntR family transcriptional regulator/MocR family aminotransferase
MKKLYREKRRTLIEVLTDAFGDTITISGDSTGLYVVAAFHALEFTDDLLEHLYREGVRLYRVEDHAIRKGKHAHKVILGYGNLRKEAIIEGVNKLKSVLGK